MIESLSGTIIISFNDLRGFYIQSIMESEDKAKCLSDAIKTSDHSAVYEFSRLLLRARPEDVQYQQCFILSAIKLSRSEEVAQQYFKHPPLTQPLQQLYAYYLYDRGEFSKTIDYINSIKHSASLNLLLAQAHFRSFKYDQSAEIMVGLLKDTNLLEQEREEYMINLMATGMNRVLSSDVVKSYEKVILGAERKQLLYNYSLAMFECGQCQRSLDYLKEFENSLNEGRDNDDIVAVRLFRDFVQWSLGSTHEKGINETYEAMLAGITNKNIKGVIHNNMLFFRQGQTIEHTHDVLRMLEECLESDVKMTKKQRNLVHLNKLTVLLKKGKFTEAQKLLKELEGKEELQRDVNYIKSRYYLLKKCKDVDIGSYIQHVSSFNSELGYCLRVDNEKEKGAETELIADIKTKGREASHPIIKHYIFSLLIKHSSLFEQYSEHLAEMAELTNDPSILHILLDIYENKQDAQKQKFILTRLLTLQPKEASVKVKLATLYLQEQRTAEAEEVLRGIEPPEELADIAYLQFIEKNMHISIQKEAEPKQEVKQNTNSSKKRIKKKKRVRLPKNLENVVANFKGDPERWLPKWQRKGYRKKGRKGASKTQGLATVGREQKNVFAAGTSTSNRQVTREGAKKKK